MNNYQRGAERGGLIHYFDVSGNRRILTSAKRWWCEMVIVPVYIEGAVGATSVHYWNIFLLYVGYGKKDKKSIEKSGEKRSVQ